MSLSDSHAKDSQPALGTRMASGVHSSSGARGLTLLGSTLLVLACPVAVWYLIGDLSESPLPPAQSDYLMRPVSLPGWVENTAGIVAIVLILACVALLYRQRTRGLTTPRTWITIALLILAGMITGFAERVITAAGIGANIGGGFMILVALPGAAILVLSAAIFWVVSYTRQRLR